MYDSEFSLDYKNISLTTEKNAYHINRTSVYNQDIFPPAWNSVITSAVISQEFDEKILYVVCAFLKKKHLQFWKLNRFA